MLSNLSMAVAFCNPSELRSTPCDGQSGPLSPRPYHKLALHVTTWLIRGHYLSFFTHTTEPRRARGSTAVAVPSNQPSPTTSST